MSRKDYVRLEPFDGFVRKCSGHLQNYEMAEKYSRKIGAVLDFVAVLNLINRHFVCYSVDVVEVYLLLKSPHVALLKPLPESMDLGSFQAIVLTADIVVARHVDKLYLRCFVRKYAFKSLKIPGEKVI